MEIDIDHEMAVLDRKVAASPHMPLIRLRMQQIARLLAEAPLPPLAEAPGRPPRLENALRGYAGAATGAGAAAPSA